MKIVDESQGLVQRAGAISMEWLAFQGNLKQTRKSLTKYKALCNARARL